MWMLRTQEKFVGPDVDYLKRNIPHIFKQKRILITKRKYINISGSNVPSFKDLPKIGDHSCTDAAVQSGHFTNSHMFKFLYYF